MIFERGLKSCIVFSANFPSCCFLGPLFEATLTEFDQIRPSDYAGFGRIRLDSVGLGRTWSDLVGFVRIWLDLVGVSRNRSESVGIGRNWSDSVGIGRIRSESVRFGRSSPWEGTFSCQ